LRANAESQRKDNPDIQDNDPILLHNVVPAAFGLALDWLLTGTIDCHKSHRASSQSQDSHYTIFCSLYVFAENYKLPKLSIAAVQRIKACLIEAPWTPCWREIQYVFIETDEDSPLRTILVNQFTRNFVNQSVAEFKSKVESWTQAATCHPEFHARVMTAIKVQQAIRPRETKRRKCATSSGTTFPKELSESFCEA